jgi:hypothetical protein
VDSLVCSRCGSTEGVELEDSRTCYQPKPKTYWDHLLGQEPEDPNKPVPLCRECAEMHHEFWDAQWSEYYNSMG